MYLRLQNIIQRQYFLGPDSRKGLKKWARPGLILRVTICARTCASSSSRNSYFLNPHCQPYWVLLGSPMHMDPRPSQQHAGLQHAVWQLPHEVTNPRQGRGRGWMGGAIRCRHCYWRNDMTPRLGDSTKKILVKLKQGPDRICHGAL